MELIRFTVPLLTDCLSGQRGRLQWVRVCVKRYRTSPHPGRRLAPAFVVTWDHIRAEPRLWCIHGDLPVLLVEFCGCRHCFRIRCPETVPIVIRARNVQPIWVGGTVMAVRRQRGDAVRYRKTGLIGLVSTGEWTGGGKGGG